MSELVRDPHSLDDSSERFAYMMNNLYSAVDGERLNVTGSNQFAIVAQYGATSVIGLTLLPSTKVRPRPTSMVFLCRVVHRLSQSCLWTQTEGRHHQG